MCPYPFPTIGLLYAIGGFDGVSPLCSAEKYDPRTNKWTPIADMIAKRFGLGACAWEGEEGGGEVRGQSALAL